MRTQVISTTYKGVLLACYWHCFTKNVEFIAGEKTLTLYTAFGFLNRRKVAKLNGAMNIDIHFRKLSKQNIAIVMLKIKGILLKAQAIDITTGSKLSFSAIPYPQLIER
jgi:hypothetical protein